jgi:D-serine deaminase-like pyridoxal phosphate-dependent protein
VTSDGDLVRFERATEDLDPPFAIVDIEAFDNNARDLVAAASGKPIRLASKSVRCRFLQHRALALKGFSGTLAFTLPEALWLHDNGFEDIVIAYPTAHRDALRELARSDIDVTLMVDSVEHLDLISAIVGKCSSPLRVCIDLDAGWWLFDGRVRIGAQRSPVHHANEAATLATAIVSRGGFQLVGLMAYESQIAGVGDRPPGHPVRALMIQSMQRFSGRELAERRAMVVDAVTSIAPLRFVNGGGTGSLRDTSAEAAVTEVTAGSGLYAPTLFDAYRRLALRPAALFALSVVRKPSPRVATVLGGGYLASGAADKSRLPRPYLPPGLKLNGQEGAGEVQTPVLGSAAAGLNLGDRVYFRHAKAGELCERFDHLFLIEGDRIVDETPTYRGEGQTFL